MVYTHGGQVAVVRSHVVEPSDRHVTVEQSVLLAAPVADTAVHCT